MFFCTGLCSAIAPVDGPTSATPYLSSSGITASVLGVPRFSSSATTFLSSISTRVFSSERLASRPSSMPDHLDLLAVDATLGH
jgi:hypothetical protein